MSKICLGLLTKIFAVCALFIVTLDIRAGEVIIDNPGPGVFNVPSSTNELTVELWGAGGAGGAVGRGGGGGGAYSIETLQVNPGEPVSYYVGQGAASESEEVGESTWFKSSGDILAEGGDSAPNSGFRQGGIGGALGLFSGGSGGAGSFLTGGGGGSSAGSSQDGSDANGSTAGIAPLGGGNGGAGGGTILILGGDGEPGDQPGGGGGGAGAGLFASGSGGAGGHGRIRLSWTQNETFCSDIYTAPNGINNNLPDFRKLDLSVFEPRTPSPWPSNNVIPAGNHIYPGRDFARNNISMSVEGKARVLVDGDLTVSKNNFTMNKGGDADDLFLIVDGDLTFENNAELNAVIYVTGDIDFKNNSVIVGALAAEGSIDTGGGDSEFTYDAEASNNVDFGGACVDEESGSGLDHLRIVHPDVGLTCRASEITILACSNSSSDTSCDLYTEPVEVTLGPSGWEPSASFVMEGGSETRTFQRSSAENVTLELANPDPSPENGVSCLSTSGANNCVIDFKDAGFFFYTQEGAIGLPNLRAGITDNFRMAALEKDEQSGQCISLFEGQTKNIAFNTRYLDPGPANRDGEHTIIEGVEVNRYDVERTNIPVTFNENGVAPLTLRYDDAGLNGLSARYIEPDQPDGGTLVIEGASTFKSAPYGLCLIPEKQCASDNIGCTETHVAGTELAVLPKAYSWSGTVDELSCQAKQPAPSFALSDVKLEQNILLPDPTEGGVKGADLGSISFGEGEQQLIFTEVGIFEAYTEAVPTGYLGLDVPASDKMMTPRFIPERLEYVTSSPDPLRFHSECSGFAYLDQPFGWDGGNLPVLEFEALNGQEPPSRTKNYTNPAILDAILQPDDFDFSAPTGSDQVGTWVTDGGIVSEEIAPLEAKFSAGSVSEGVPGVVEYQFSGADEFELSKDNVLEPFDANMEFALVPTSDGDGVPLTPTDLKVSAGGMELRYGRLVMENVYGPEASGTLLTMPFSVEYFKGDTFQNNLLDDGGLNGSSGCTVWNPAQVSVMDSTVDNPAPPHYQMNTSGNGDFLEGQAELEFEAMGIQATDTLEWDLTSIPWLRHYWGYEDAAAGVDELQNPRATATFGVYRGNDRIIYWREVR